MHLDSAVADAEFIGDRSVRHADGEQAKHGILSRRELFQTVAAPGWRSAPGGAENVPLQVLQAIDRELGIYRHAGADQANRPDYRIDAEIARQQAVQAMPQRGADPLRRHGRDD